MYKIIAINHTAHKKAVAVFLNLDTLSAMRFMDDDNVSVNESIENEYQKKLAQNEAKGKGFFTRWAKIYPSEN